MPRVTVVIPCYNHGRFLNEAVESVLAQTYGGYEIFIVNDGSTDPFTVDLLSKYKKERTTVFHKANGHLSSARNFGIARANSEYILTLDADDRFAPRFLEKAVSILDAKSEAGVATCWHETFGGTKRAVCTLKNGGNVINFLTRNLCSASSLFRKRCWEEVGGYDERMKQGYEDWNFWIAVTKKGWRVEVIPEVLFYYRISKSSMVSASDDLRPELMRQIVRNHLDVYREYVEDVVYEEERVIQKLNQDLENLRGSAGYRLGRCVTQPLAVIKAVLQRLQKKPE